MPAKAPQPAGPMKEGAVRKRRAHQKSRRGCRNCKLRKVKCDETRPECEKCVSFGVTCNYDAKASDLQPSYDKQVSLSVDVITPPATPSSNPISTSSSPPWPTAARPPTQALVSKYRLPRCISPIISTGTCDDTSSFQLDTECLSRLERFQRRTVLTIGTASAGKHFSTLAVDLALQHPYLMHIVQVLTTLHDRHLSPTPYSPRTLPEIYHLSRAASLFNSKLSSPIPPSDRDGLWATAALLGLISFSLTDASCAEDSWPLAPLPEGQDPLEWITIAESKSAVWAVTNPLREGSRFAVMKTDYESAHSPFSVPLNGIEGLSKEWVEWLGLDEWISKKTSAYFTAIHVLSPLLQIPCERSNIIHFLGFISHMETPFRDLLRRRDKRALCILACWYAKVWKAVWWIERRAVLECKAICLYLERWYGDDKKLMELLKFPRRKCGLEESIEMSWIGDGELGLLGKGEWVAPYVPSEGGMRVGYGLVENREWVEPR